MHHAWGRINALVRGGALVYEALYQPSYRHTWRRVHCALAPDFTHHASEADAVAALLAQAARDGASITVQAGSYPRGTRREGQILEIEARP